MKPRGPYPPPVRMIPYDFCRVCRVWVPLNGPTSVAVRCKQCKKENK